MIDFGQPLLDLDGNPVKDSEAKVSIIDGKEHQELVPTERDMTLGLVCSRILMGTGMKGFDENSADEKCLRLKLGQLAYSQEPHELKSEEQTFLKAAINNNSENPLLVGQAYQMLDPSSNGSG